MKLATYAHPSPLLVTRKSLELSLRDLGAEAQIDFRRLSLIERGFSDDEVKRLTRAIKKLTGTTVAATDVV